MASCKTDFGKRDVCSMYTREESIHTRREEASALKAYLAYLFFFLFSIVYIVHAVRKLLTKAAKVAETSFF